jgi:hypothetical protein
VLLIDTQDRVLLLRANVGADDVWITPGGALEPGETLLLHFEPNTCRRSERLADATRGDDAGYQEEQELESADRAAGGDQGG